MVKTRATGLGRASPDDSGPYSLLLMGFGQSNADIHDAGPRQFPEPEDAAEIYMPDDSRGFRGWGYLPQTKPITGFVPVTDAGPKIQSILAAAAGRILAEKMDHPPARTIVRSGAVGGRRFGAIPRGDGEVAGIYTNLNGDRSLIYHQFVDTIRQCVMVSRQDGPPITQVYVVWLHGEADRAMARPVYTDLLLRMIRETEEALSDLGVSINWALVQASGSGDRGSGNDWPNRISVFDAARQHETAFVPAAAYGYEMIDGSHFAGPGKLRLGEVIGAQVSRHMRDAFQPLPLPVSMQLSGLTAQIHFPRGTELVFDTSAIPAPDPGLGFSCAMPQLARVVDARVTDPATVELTFDTQPDPESLVIRYAYMRNRSGHSTITPSDFPVGRGCLRTSRVTPSLLQAGVALYEWIPGFSISMTHGPNPI